MTNALRSNIEQLASTFAAAVVSAIRSANLDDILSVGEPGRAASPGPARSRSRRAPAKTLAATAPAKAPSVASARRTTGGRLKRRSPDDIATALAHVVNLLKTKKAGLRAEQIRGALKMESKELPRVLKEGLSKKALKSRGQRRGTTYTAA